MSLLPLSPVPTEMPDHCIICIYGTALAPPPPGDGHGSPATPCGVGGVNGVGVIDFDEGRSLCKC